jgi:hypothetical protein
MFVKNEYLVYIQTYCIYDMQILVSACFLQIIYKKDFTCFLAGYQLKNEPLITFVAFATWHLQRATFYQIKDVFLHNTYCYHKLHAEEPAWVSRMELQVLFEWKTPILAPLIYEPH